MRCTRRLIAATLIALSSGAVQAGGLLSIPITVEKKRFDVERQTTTSEQIIGGR